MIKLRGGILQWNSVNKLLKFENCYLDIENYNITNYGITSTISMSFKEFNPKILRVISKTTKQLDSYET